MTTTSVLLVTPRWSRDGGVGAHVKESAAALAANGVAVGVAAAQLDGDETPAGVTLFHTPNLFTPKAQVNVRLGDALSFEHEVVHLHQVDDPELLGALRLTAPVVMSAHGYPACTSGAYYFQPGHECTRGHGPGCVPNLLARGCAHTRYPKTLPRKYLNATRGLAAFRGADLAVSYSSSVDRHLAANGIDERTIVPYFPTMQARQGSGHETRRRVVFAGRIVRAKGVGVLIRAARKVDAEFVLCGDGRELAAMRTLARKLGVAERIRFSGWLSAADLAGELADASVVVVPSVWPEPFGLVGIEAFATGRPAIASATGGIGDWLQDGVSGLMVPPGDPGALARALQQLLSDTNLQSRMGQAGKEFVAERFSPQRHVAALLEGYGRARVSWGTRT
jgi:glycosyltransferase involved in cell wall biosynthesis